MEVEQSNAKLAARLISRALKSESFTRRCKLKIRFVSVLSAQTRGSALGEKIKKCQFKHNKMLYSLSRAYTWELGPLIDGRIQELKGRRLREILMEMKAQDGTSSLFVGIDKKWGHDNGWTFTFGKKYKTRQGTKSPTLDRIWHINMV